MDFAQGSQSDIFGTAPARPQASRRPLSSHRAFAPMLGVWGAGLGLAIAMVLPVAAVEAFAASVPADLAPLAARGALAGCIALALALIAYGTGRALGHRHLGGARPPRRKARGVEPIDPASELGSDSFDAPLPAGLFAQEAEWLPEPPAPEALAAEAAAQLAAVRAASDPAPAAPRARAPEPEPEPEPDNVLPAPVALDLAEFAALPGRNAVWVHEPSPVGEDCAEPAAAPAPNPDPALVSAIARLRAVPPDELSLCEMVERFAAALQDYQAAAEARGDSKDARTEREAMLQEALGALGRITGKGLGQHRQASGPGLRARLWADADGRSRQRGAA